MKILLTVQPQVPSCWNFLWGQTPRGPRKGSGICFRSSWRFLAKPQGWERYRESLTEKLSPLVPGGTRCPSSSSPRAGVQVVGPVAVIHELLHVRATVILLVFLLGAEAAHLLLPAVLY